MWGRIFFRMDFVAVTIFIAVVSFLWAVWSLRELQKDERVDKKVKEDLSVNRVVFQSQPLPQASSSEDSSDTSSAS